MSNPNVDIDKIRQAAESGDAKAQYSLANAYQYGYGGVKKNMKTAAEWYRRAAEGGHMESQCNYGLCFANGAGVKKDFSQAVVWFRKAALQGDDLAQRYVGNSYSNGDGVKVDKAEAAKWWKMAADQDDPIAQCNLADLYLAGEGVPQDKAEAVRLYRAASEGDDYFALFKLGLCYLNGDGTDPDEVEGLRCIKEAAEAGVPDAEKWLKQKTKQRDRRLRGGKSRLWDILTTDRYTWVIYAVMWAIAALIALWFKFKG
ncbi:MAG: sel1 repeat family protein [Thermoguttaceae bacterium]|nr:sel1 repeat family protein [Thermoguttaceae bacterium]